MGWPSSLGHFKLWLIILNINSAFITYLWSCPNRMKKLVLLLLVCVYMIHAEHVLVKGQPSGGLRLSALFWRSNSVVDLALHMVKIAGSKFPADSPVSASYFSWRARSTHTNLIQHFMWVLRTVLKSPAFATSPLTQRDLSLAWLFIFTIRKI